MKLLRLHLLLAIALALLTASPGPALHARPRAPARVGQSASSKAQGRSEEPGQPCPGPPTRLPAASRVVAIGDIHGDLEALRGALRLARATDSKGRWVGQDLVVVLVGDLIDRGNQDREVLELVERLGQQARAAGGALLPLLGNHEVMNVYGQLQ